MTKRRNADGELEGRRCAAAGGAHADDGDAVAMTVALVSDLPMAVGTTVLLAELSLSPPAVVVPVPFPVVGRRR